MKLSFISAALSVLLISLCFRVLGQEKQVQIPMYKSGDTTLWYKWCQRDIKKVGLPSLTTSSDSFRLRFSTETQAIDIWTTDYKTFQGTLANFTTASRSDKFYSDITPIDTATARKVYDVFVALAIFGIPAQDSIKGWSNGCDGITYMIETSTRSKYTFKYYWTPSVFSDSLKEAKAVDSLSHEMERILHMHESFVAFIRTLPEGSYHAGGAMFIFIPRERKSIFHKQRK